jgi:hypothetical protein
MGVAVAVRGLRLAAAGFTALVQSTGSVANSLHVVWMAVLIGLGMVLLAPAVMRIGRQRLAAQSRSPAARTMSKRT